MSLRNIGIVYRKELIDSLRDQRTLISMIAVPLLLVPLLTIGLLVVMVRQVGEASEEVPKVMILGGEDSPNVRAELEKLQGVKIVPENSDYTEQISNKRIRAAVEIPPGFDAKLAAGEPMSVKIYMYQGELKSGFGANRLEKFFRDLRDRAIRERLEARHLPESMVRPFDIKQQNVASREKVGGALIGGLVPYFIILLCLTGAMYPAMDLASGAGKIPDGSHGFGRHGRALGHLHDRFIWRGKEIAAKRGQRRRRHSPANHDDRQGSDFRVHNGFASGGAVFSSATGDRIVRQKL